MVIIIWIWEKCWVQQQKFNLIKYSIDFHLKSHLFIDEGTFCWKKCLTFDTQNANAHWKNCIDWNLIEYLNRFKVKENSQPSGNKKKKNKWSRKADLFYLLLFVNVRLKQLKYLSGINDNYRLIFELIVDVDNLSKAVLVDDEVDWCLDNWAVTLGKKTNCIHWKVSNSINKTQNK